MDRRGSGASGDVAPYAIEREFEDVAAVVDAVAARTGGPVALFGHSYGCNPAMGGATLTTNVHHLVLYEPSFGLSYLAGSIEAIEQAVAAGDREAAIRAAFVDTGVMTDEELEALQATPRWPKLVAAAHTRPREAGLRTAGRTGPASSTGLQRRHFWWRAPTPVRHWPRRRSKPRRPFRTPTSACSTGMATSPSRPNPPCSQRSCETTSRRNPRTWLMMGA